MFAAAGPAGFEREARSRLRDPAPSTAASLPVGEAAPAAAPALTPEPGLGPALLPHWRADPGTGLAWLVWEREGGAPGPSQPAPIAAAAAVDPAGGSAPTWGPDLAPPSLGWSPSAGTPGRTLRLPPPFEPPLPIPTGPPRGSLAPLSARPDVTPLLRLSLQDVPIEPELRFLEAPAPELPPLPRGVW